MERSRGTGNVVRTGGGEGEPERFARLMRELKGRAGLSYGALARKLHTSTSTLHRYCNGEALPAEFAVVDRFARLCGATPGEAVELHRAWLLADARRRATARVPEATTATGAVAVAVAGAVPEVVEAVVPEVAEGAAEEGVPEVVEAAVGAGAEVEVAVDVAEGAVVELAVPDQAPRPLWYRRRATTAAAVGVTMGAVAMAVLAAAGGPERGTPTAGPDAGRAATAAASGAVPGPLTPSVLTSRSPGLSPPPSPSPFLSPSPLPSSSPTVPSGGGPSAPPPAPGPTPASAAPLRAAVRSHVWAAGCDHSYLTERAPRSVPAPPLEEDASAWASAQRAVHAGSQIVEVTLHGTGAGAVVLEGLGVRVTDRRTPPAWNVYRMSLGCGGALTPAVFAVNLDAPRPLARPVEGNNEGTTLPAPVFPMSVSAAEPVVLRVEATTADCDCDWSLDLRWTGPSGSGTLRIDDGGRPLRTSAAAGRPVYGYADDLGRWTR
ncbi:helix-turn-helix domain-containing protein [Streptomyces sp. NPDC051567]|uniref:helix-turn-helix domain-containing protein n=1 Tax=Streptomyces sp. NPDC051567 TaxID=3365660 RepID=UPI00378AD342